MLTVDDYSRIRRAHLDGMRIRAIARKFRRSRRKIREVLKTPEPKPFRRPSGWPAPKLGSFHDIIQSILAQDEYVIPLSRDPGQLLEADFGHIC